MKPSKKIKPCARKEGLVVRELPDETLVYDLERDRAHCLNETAALVWQRCDGRNTTREIAEALARRLDQPIDERLVWLAIERLGENHLLTDVPVPPQGIAGMNRRELVCALGLSAAVAIPVVASIVAPMPAQAATCKPSGQPCVSPTECCSGLCNTGTCA